MRVVIIRQQNVVLVDERPLPVDCSSLDPRIYVIQWGGTKGWIEYINDPHGTADDWKANDLIDDFTPYQFLVDAWETFRIIADAPKPPNSMLDDFDFGKSIADMLSTSTGAM